MALEPPTNARTANAQGVETQSVGPGKRIGGRSELALFCTVAPGGAAVFRERLPRFQAEAAYWQARIGTAHDFRVFLFDDDRRLAVVMTYDGDFQTHVTDMFAQAGPWFDDVFSGVWEGYEGAHDPRSARRLLDCATTADLFYVAHPDVTVREIARMKRLSRAVGDVLDAAS